MAVYKEIRPVRRIAGTCAHGADLLAELVAVCQEEEIRFGRVEAIGAVQRAVVGYYDQGTHQHREVTIPRPLELVGLVGNVSLHAGRTVLHAHVALADSRGHAWGGHLRSGSIVYSVEFEIEVWEGPSFEREEDARTGLTSWSL
jgi:hypothetical protein